MPFVNRQSGGDALNTNSCISYNLSLSANATEYPLERFGPQPVLNWPTAYISKETGPHWPCWDTTETDPKLLAELGILPGRYPLTH